MALPQSGRLGAAGLGGFRLGAVTATIAFVPQTGMAASNLAGAAARSAVSATSARSALSGTTAKGGIA